MVSCVCWSRDIRRLPPEVAREVADGVAVVVTPVVTAALADTRVQGRTLLGLMFAGSGLSLAWLAGAEGYWSILIAHGLFALAFAPVTSLQDGLYFQRSAELAPGSSGNPGSPGNGNAAGQVPDYHHVRVFGTFGFIAPSLILYFVLRHEAVDTTAAVWCAVVCCGVGVLNACLLPRTRRAENESPEEPQGTLSRKRPFRARGRGLASAMHHRLRAPMSACAAASPAQASSLSGSYTWPFGP